MSSDSKPSVFDKLPAELIQAIGEAGGPQVICTLQRTCNHLNEVLEPSLYRSVQKENAFESEEAYNAYLDSLETDPSQFAPRLPRMCLLPRLPREIDVLTKQIAADQVEHVRKLLDAGMDPNSFTKQGLRLLHQAIHSQGSDKKVFGLLLERGADPNLGAYKNARETPLAVVSRILCFGDKFHHVVQKLVKYGARPNTSQDLYRIFLCGDQETVLVSIKAASDLLAGLSDTDSDLAHALCFNKKVDLLPTLIQAFPKLLHGTRKGEDALRSAVRGGNGLAMAQLLDLGIDTTTVGPDGDTILHVAAYHTMGGLMKALLDKGVDVNTRGDFGRTALHAVAASSFSLRFIHGERHNGDLADTWSEMDCAKLLLDAGVDREVVDSRGKKACDYAFNSPDLEAFLSADVP